MVDRSAALGELRALLGERLSVALAVREQHGRDEGWLPPLPPDAVAFAHSTGEVSAIVGICARHRMPVIPFGTGTSIEGQISAVRGGLSLDLSGMNRVLAVNAADLDAVVQPGVTRKQLNDHLRDTGLFFPIDPGADASLGGMAATRASGTNAVRYGTMRDNVLALQVVLADGEIIHTGTRARKSAAGYDLTRLFIGSEGTLGVITELTVKLSGIPEAISSAVCAFPAVAAAVDSVIAIIQSGVPVARIEFLDEAQIRATNAYAGLGHEAAPTLFFEFHGSAAGVVEQAETAQEIASDHGGRAFQWATRPEERTRLWQARHNVLYAALALRPGCRAFTTDVCVPISRLTECIVETRADIERTGLLATMAGHVGDGNFHTVFLIDPDDAAELARVKQASSRMVERAIAMGGTCTGEHGVGLGKMDYLAAEHGGGLKVMATLKRALDPEGLLNPGKIVVPGA
jgi:D-lactate dehydrogenase (cytochrome)